jgi:hypothetical protein
MNPDTANSSSLPTPEPASPGAAPTQPVGATPTPPAVPAAKPGATPEVAADNDRIEQEWVLKTKQILLATHNDPFEQARQLAALKADYMMKRYNKEIKLGE